MWRGSLIQTRVLLYSDAFKSPGRAQQVFMNFFFIISHHIPIWNVNPMIVKMSSAQDWSPQIAFSQSTSFWLSAVNLAPGSSKHRRASWNKPLHPSYQIHLNHRRCAHLITRLFEIPPAGCGKPMEYEGDELMESLTTIQDGNGALWASVASGS